MSDSWSGLIRGEELCEEYLSRKKTEIEKRISVNEIQAYEEHGWIIKKQYKNGSAIVLHPKNAQAMLVDRLWTIFYRMGFTVMNSNAPVEFSYRTQYYSGTKSVDIIAIDDETCLFIDCFASEELNRVRSFGENIEAIARSFRLLSAEVKDTFGDRKCKYIFVSSNYVLSYLDLDNLSKNRIVYFDEENVDYYYSLVDHLGVAARYQLLGNLFSKTTIKGMDERVPAIEGKMGNMPYYAFLIEPERLLKIGYVLHRNKANRDQMPTYQRLIKKERLKAIRNFVDNGGFFPNSIIISIDSKDGRLRFDKAPQELQSTHSRIGVLYLPKEYQSAYIIDGQHRLYGYSESKYASRDTIPVIAFVNMDKEMQVKMFMDINENQKPVSKTLRNILNIDLNWNADNLNKRREAVILSVSQELGENSNSPLFGRVLTGEDSVNERRCITIEYLKTALDKTCFFNKYNKKNEIIERGVFDKIDSSQTFQTVYSYLRSCLQVLADLCKNEWEKGSAGFLTINNMIVAVIRVISDITNITVSKNDLDLSNIDIDELYQQSKDLLLDLSAVINNLPQEKRNEIKSAKGSSAKEISWRILQVALNTYNGAFINADLARYIEENCTDYNPEGLRKALWIKDCIIGIVREKFVDKIDWENLYIAEDLAIKLNQKVAAQRIKNSRAGIEHAITIWDVIEFDDICKVLNFKANWSMLLREGFLSHNITANRADIVNTLKSIQTCEQKINNGKHITKSEYFVINDFYGKLRGDRVS